MKRADIYSTNYQSILGISAGTKKGQRWLTRNVGTDPTIYCEHRYGVDILQGAIADGLTLEDSTTSRRVNA